MEILRKKQKIHLYILLLIAISIGILIFLSIKYLDHYVLSIIFLLAIILLMIALFYTKAKYDYYTRNYFYNRLIDSAEKPLKINRNLNINSVTDILSKDGYKIFIQDANFILFYKYERIEERKRQKSLYAMLIYLGNDYSFNNSFTNKYFGALEDEISKKDKYVQRLFFQLSIDSQKTIEEANDVLFLSNRNENYVLLNITINNINKVIYFLHSNKFSPNRYYTLAVNELYKLFIKWFI